MSPILRGDPFNPEKSLIFERFVKFPGNLSKFDIHWDDVGKRYYSIVSRVWNQDRPTTRNLLSLISSEDLEYWELEYDLLDYTHMNAQQVGFQYVSFLFDKEDLLYLCRTAFNGAESYHDNNYITFHRVQNFRKKM